MGTHGRRGYDRLVLGSVTDRVMRTAPLSGTSGQKIGARCGESVAFAGSTPPPRSNSVLRGLL
ncbi:MAG TPA: universal stress protein [Terriglobales bacterium]